MTSEVLLVGSGGVGTIASLGLELGGKARVTSVIRSDYNIVKEKGFEIESVDHGKFQNWRPSAIVKSVDEAAQLDKEFDFVVVCMKVLPELYKAEEVIAPAIGRNTTIVLIQNGIGIEEPVAQKFPLNVVLSGVSMIGSQNFHGKILQNEHDSLKIGYYDSPEITDKGLLEGTAKKFVEIYAACGVDAVFEPQLTVARWRKLVYNSCINTCCAATQLDAGRMFLAGCDKSLILPAMAEIKKIAHAALGEPLTPDDIDIKMLESDDGVYYKPSMQVDIEKGNPIELEAILGNPLQIAQRHNVDAPLLTFLYRILKGIQFRLMEGRGHIKCPEEGASRKKHEPIWSYPYES